MSAPAPEAAPSWIVALDVGGSSIKSGTFSASGQPVAPPVSTPILSGGSSSEIITTLATALAREAEAIPPGLSWRAALGFPGPFDYGNGISLIRNVAKFDSLLGLNIRTALLARLADRPPHGLMFFNDALAAIVGETQTGAGRTASRVLGITLGTGLGSAFLIDGQPVNFTKESGMPPGGWLYACDFAGRPADEMFSTRGLQGRAKAAGLDAPDLGALAAFASSGDSKALKVWEDFGNDLGRFLHPYLHAFSADQLLVLGGIATAWPHFGPAVQCAVAPRVATAGLLGPPAALHGLHALLSSPARLGSSKRRRAGP